MRPKWYQIRRKLCSEEQGLRLKRQAFAVLNVTEYVDSASRTMKARKFRRRADEVEEDAEESEKTTIKAPTDKLSKEKEKAKSTPPTKTTGPLLSFAEDEEYAGDRETKGSSSSGRSASKKEKSKPRPGSKSGNGSLLSFGGEDEEKVGNGISAQKIRKKSSGLGLGHGSSQRFGFGRDKSAAGLSLPSNMQAQVGEYTKENGAESGGITHIPDAAAIAAAKAMRERARQAQSAPDYISLAPGDGIELRSRLCDSGLVREHDDAVEGEEDDSSADEGEIQGRLAFMGEKITDPKNRTGVFEATEEMASEERPVLEPRDEDEEDEERRWEEEQLRKGYGKRVEEAPPRSTAAAPAGPSQAQVPAYITAVQPVVPSCGVRGFGRSLEGLSIAQQAEAAMRSLQESVQRLRETHSRTQNDLHRAQENLASTVQNVTSF
ncbi:hypothetical protein R1flu_028761 [Riccia fluitans]|uniref:Uncharacterized protein n=1 Tax=Riccia fluitans TaxID=41844 RepID=A0ABD1XN94_9MARC